MTKSGVPTRRAVLMAPLALLGACVGGSRLAPPSQGGPAWLELRTERFKVLTDLGRRGAERVIAELERVYALLAKATDYGSDREALATRVFAFRTYDELQQFIPSRTTGLYTNRLKEEGDSFPTLLIHGNLEDFGRTLFAHELAHRFMGSALGPAGPWLHEGLAEYYSTVHGTPDALVVGDLDGENVCASGKPWAAPGYVVYSGERLLVSSLPAASRVVTLEPSDFYGQEEEGGRLSWEANERMKRHYFVSWALVHMLLHDDDLPYALEAQRTLSSTNPKAGQEIERIVGEVAAERLDEDLRRYLGKSMRLHPRREPPAKAPTNLEVRELRDEEVRDYLTLLEPLRKVRQAPH